MSAELVLEGALSEAGLPTDPAKIVGKNFLFQRNERSFIIGTIVGIEFSEKLSILITPLTVWGGSIDRIQYYRQGWTDKTWVVAVDTSGGDYEFEDYPGDFKILASV